MKVDYQPKKIADILNPAISDLQELLNPNKLQSFGYKSYPERVEEALFDLSELRDDKMSNFFNEEILNMPHYVVPRDFEDGVLFDVGSIYQVGMLDRYLGNIPPSNQSEIIAKYNSLKSNPMIDGLKNCLAILAPKNNFEGTENANGIDPIVYAIFKVRHQYKLIQLTQWL